MQLDKKALGLATGLLWGVTVLLVTIWVMVAGGGEHLILLGKFYLGYDLTLLGAILGTVYGFIDGFIGGWVFAWLYNKFAAGSR
jgi:hypothetical protein